MGGPASAGRNTVLYLSESQRAHLLLADGRRPLMVGLLRHHGLVTALTESV